MIEYRTTSSDANGEWTFTPIMIDDSYFDIFHSSEGTPDQERILQEGLAQGLITLIQN
jgi:hypothetical protein